MIFYKHDTISKQKSKIKISDLIITILLVLLIAILINNPTKYGAATITGFNLFALGVFPTLFPFIFISKILSALETPIFISSKLKTVANKVFRAPSSIIYVYLISIICGYPIGAKMTSDLYENGTISDLQIKNFNYFCSTSGILFVIGTIGTIMFKSAFIGFIIYISHILGCFIGGLILSRLDTNYDLTEKPLNNSRSVNLIATSISNSIQSILIVGAYITLFCLFTQILLDLTCFEWLTIALNQILTSIGLDGRISTGFITGIFEMTNGCKFLSTLSTKSAAAIACGLISFGGISIILQSHTFLKNTKIKARTLVFTKFVHSICSIIIASLILLIV